MKIININGIDYNVNIIYKRYNKNVYLRVKEGVIQITTPTRLSDFTIKDIIISNYNHIVKVMNETSKIEDKIHYLGNEYELIIKESNNDIAYVDNDKFIVEVTNSNFASKSVELFYTNTLKNIVRNYAKDILIKFNIFDDVTFSYKNVKGYFGECFSKRKHIILSTKLAKYDLKYILSVIYHECAHFKYHNHQNEFYEYLEQLYPNYRKIQKELRRIKYQDKY